MPPALQLGVNLKPIKDPNQRDALARLRFVIIGALLHGSRFGRGYPNPTVVYATTTAVRTEFGRPAVSMRLSTATATVASVH